MGKPKPTRPVSLPGGYPHGAEPFLAGIIADRGADAPRLVFADWLQENGDEAHAEFIRVQIEFENRHPKWEESTTIVYTDPKAHRATLPPDDLVLYERQRDLLARNRTAWLTGHPRWAFSHLLQTTRRGFPRAVRAAPSQWARDGEALRRWFPLEEVTLEGAREDFASLHAVTSLTGLDRLTLWQVGDKQLRSLAGSAVFGAAPVLDVVSWYGPIDPSAARAALDSPALEGVRELHCRLPGDSFARAVAASPHLRNLRGLFVRFVSGSTSTEVARALFASPNMANLERLALSNHQIGDGGVRGLVESPYATRLVRIDLSFTGLTGETGRMLAAWPGLRSVESLDLSNNPLGLDGLTALSESSYIEGLRHLQVTGCVDVNAFGAVGALPGFAHVRVT